MTYASRILTVEKRTSLPDIYFQTAKDTGFQVKFPADFLKYCRGRFGGYMGFIEFADSGLPFSDKKMEVFFDSRDLQGFSIGGGLSIGGFKESVSDLRNTRRVVDEGSRILKLSERLEEERMKTRGWGRGVERPDSQDWIDYSWKLKSENEMDVGNLKRFLETVRNNI